ncbi:MAG: hypothetical protein COB84_04270 [Rhodobacteraceae bacterium]|nr:MAG: hypothetical protein COB84_04270 [Paracoccaceae bacterium]
MEPILAYLRKGGAITPSLQPIGGELRVDSYIIHPNNEIELVKWWVQIGDDAVYSNGPNPLPENTTVHHFTGTVTGYQYVVNERNKLWFTHSGTLSLLTPEMAKKYSQS